MEGVRGFLADVTRAELEGIKTELREELREIRQDFDKLRERFEKSNAWISETRGRFFLMMYLIPGLTGIIGFLVAWIVHS